MFHRFHVKQQGFAKEQRVADAQLQSLRQLGLIGPETKGFASAWGGTDRIAAAAESRPPSRLGPKSSRNYTIIPPVRDFDEPTFPEKGESVSSPYSYLRSPHLPIRFDSVPTQRRARRTSTNQPVVTQ